MDENLRNEMIAKARENGEKHGKTSELDFGAGAEWMYERVVKLLATTAVSKSVQPVRESTVCNCHRPFATKNKKGELICDYCKKIKKK